MQVTAQEWIDALKSGKYKKGRSALRNVDNEFCCLGVLAEELGVESTLEDYDPDVYGYNFGNERHTCVLPDDVVNVDLGHELAVINDGTDDFSEVIELIQNLFFPDRYIFLGRIIL